MSEEKINQDIENRNIQPLKQKPLFTQVQIAEQVRDFIFAYRNGRIKLIPRKEEEDKYERIILNPTIGSSYKLKEKEFNSKVEHIKTKSELQNLIRVCEGTKSATDEERYQKLLELFDRILILQTDKRLEGKIESYDLKRRINELETKVSGLVGRMDVFGGNSI